MKKIFSLLIIYLAYVGILSAQVLPNRYRTEIFPTIPAPTTNIAFSTNIPHVTTTTIIFTSLQIADETTYGNVIKTLRMSIYQPPTTDTLTKRPVIIFAFGGGFVQQAKIIDMQQLAIAYAKRGFVTAVIDYRLGMNIADPEKSKRAVYRGIQDSRSAVRFFRQYGNTITYKVDANQIFLAGHSAGGFMAVHNIYLDTDAERPAYTRAVPAESLADLGVLDGVGDNKIQASGPNIGTSISGKANGALAFAGALGELSYIIGAGDAPSAYFHSSDDGTVAYTSGQPFSGIPFVNLPTVYGGFDMNTRANSVSAPHVFFPYNGSPDAPRDHDVHYDGSNIYADIPVRGGQFTYDYRLKPAAHTFTGVNSIICDQSLTQTYTIDNALNISANSDFYYDWSITNGTINTPSSPTAYSATARQYLRTISVTWNATGGARSLSVTAYQRNLGKGAAVLTQNFTLNNAPVAATAVPTQNIQIGGGAQTVNIATAFTDANSNPMTYTATSSNPANLTVSVTGNIVTLTPITSGTGGSITVTLIANDNIGGGCASAPVTFVVNINRPPVATVIPNQTLQLGGANGTLNIASFFTDADGNTLTFTSANATPTVATATLVGNTFTLAPLVAGTTTITVTANDGNGGTVSQTFTVLVNRPPTAVGTITTQTVQISGTGIVNLAPFFADADGNPLTYTAVFSPTGIATATVAGSTLTLSGVAGGTTTVTITANDGNGGTITQTFTIIVNSPPVATVIPNQTLQLGGANGTLNIASYFTDADGNTLTFTSANAIPSIATAVLTGSTFTLAPVAGGSTIITVTANDGNGGTVSQTFTVFVNRAPVATVIPNQTLQLGGANGTLNIASFFTDADGNTLTFTSANATPSIATAVLAGSTFTLAPVAAGSTIVTVTANDGNGGTITQTFTVLVNRAPVATIIPNQVIQLGAASSTFNIASYFTDADGNTLTFTSINATPSIATAVLAGSTFTITSVALGSTIITVTANDGNGGTVSQTFTITVTSLPTAVGTIPNQILQMGGSNVVLNLVPYFSSASALTYTVASVPTNIAGTVIAGTNLTLSPVAGGTTNVTVTADNGTGTITQTFTVLVNRMPTASVIPTQNLRLGDPATVLALGTYFADADANTLSYTSSVVDITKATATVSVANLSLLSVAVGTTNVTVTANDGNGGTVSQTFAVNVTTCVNVGVPIITQDLTSLTLTSSSATNNQWNKNGVAIAGATSNTLRVTEEGSYTVSLVGVANACATVISLPVVITLGNVATSLDKQLENVSLSPNPTKGAFQISMNNALRGDYEVIIYDALGKIQSSKKLNKMSLQVTEQFSVENLAAGIYYVKIISKDGVITKKVVLSE